MQKSAFGRVLFCVSTDKSVDGFPKLLQEIFRSYLRAYGSRSLPEAYLYADRNSVKDESVEFMECLKGKSSLRSYEKQGM